MPNAQVGIVMGSDSDLPVMKAAADILKQFGIGVEVVISSAHRVPDKTAQYAKTAEERGLEVIIAAAGMAAHLPGVIAAFTTLPVIGVPIQSGALAGTDALYAIVQMPPGIPVATMAINGAKNAGICAAQILSVKYPELRDKLKAYKQQLADEVTAKAEKLEAQGFEGYLAGK
ncbi:MAG: 5-(carboxyamino)imidazole ribonucleotide mutase [Thermincola sp.]|jgi:5-(carboxyamino)imidazole ribonucleotide mutase|nr:5-(carboxyamino)imidazole ribonucleotide mutase [Thermincola sp.]MDT3704473.1 5-(carboxyamino)imidazole ribonucleotide mutase [Thermincola sp.]